MYFRADIVFSGGVAVLRELEKYVKYKILLHPFFCVTILKNLVERQALRFVSASNF